MGVVNGIIELDIRLIQFNTWTHLYAFHRVVFTPKFFDALQHTLPTWGVEFS